MTAGRADAIRSALPDEYMRAKPSFERCVARAAKGGVEGLTRDEFAALKGRAPGEARRPSGGPEPHNVRSLEDLYEHSDVDPEKWDAGRGALYATQGTPPRERVLGALLAAEAVVPSVRGPFGVLCSPEEPVRRGRKKAG